MTVNELAAACSFEIIVPDTQNKTVDGAYACDLLSWVIGRANENAALITVMTNVNVIAVAVMADLSCVILCEGEQLDETALEKAKTQGVPVLMSKQSVYETCLAVGAVL